MRSKSKEIPINSEIFKLNHKWTVTHRPCTHATPKFFQTQNIDAVRTVMFAFTPNMTSLYRHSKCRHPNLDAMRHRMRTKTLRDAMRHRMRTKTLRVGQAKVGCCGLACSCSFIVVAPVRSNLKSLAICCGLASSCSCLGPA